MFNQIDFAFSISPVNQGRIAMTDGDKNSVRRRLQKNALPLRFTVGCMVFLYGFLDSLIQWLRFSAVNCSCSI